ncbi:T9SS type A sorting domain-containing protein [Flavobacterium anhuiense]|uniref:T9SS type A sorting domain-containing protein n=1 Tax=Flavobacterium anhuiense TaxID=459526 RepID=UPI002027444F|nr:T9SS type A sorting domain-containing protein [Flavobacterium anhuiense]URM39142.1 T9SS type A sorting domain-containing protein [Flavobacterium anhuiense]
MVLFMLFAIHPSLHSQAISGAAVQANFGIDADVYANKEQFLVPPTVSGIYDDWFFSSAFANGTGQNVIDQTNAAGLKTSIQANNNFTFEKRMSKPKNTMVGNFLWIDAVYGRDGNSTQSNNDSNTFSGNSNKNGDNPTTWALGSGSIPQKDDIVDVYGYLRRDLSPAALAVNPNGILWGYGGASKISSDGNSHFDFEFFRTEVSFNGSALVGTGSQAGHTAWTFDATGKILVPGDVLVAIDFENGGTKPLGSVRVWMSSADIANFNSRPNRPFDLTGVFDQGNGAPPYGYAEIKAKGGGILTNVFAVVNVTAATLGPPWGTLEGSQANFQDNYKALQFTEFGLNLTALGLDSRNVNQSPCSNLLGSLIVKTRSSSSFTAELKDFSGPYLFGNITDVAVVGNVSNPLTCNNPTATLTATPTPPNATIKWYGPSPDGIADGPFIPGNAPVVSVKGVYTVYAYANLEGCFAKKTVTVLENKELPNVYAGEDKALTCLITSIKLSGSSSTPNATYLWSTLDGNIVSDGTTLTPTIDKAGTYTLTVTDPINGCKKADDVVVTSTPPTTINITCPEDNIKSSCFYADQAAVNTAFDAFKQSFTASGGNGTLTITGLENLTPPALCGGTVTVNYNVTDSCGLQKSCSATFTITAPATVSAEAPTSVNASACAYADQAALDAAFEAFKAGFKVSGGCDAKGEIQGSPVAPKLCDGGTVTVTYKVTDKCYETTISRDFTITAPSAVVPVSPDPFSASACTYDDQAALDAAFETFKAGFSVSGGCDAKGEIQGSPVAPKLCDGGTVTVTYKVSDKCYEETISRDFTITAPSAVVPVSPDPFSASACTYADQAALDTAFETFKAGFSVSGGCDAKGEIQGSPTAPKLCDGGTVTVTYKVSDKCYEETISRDFTITAPSAVVPVSPDPFSASACAYADQAELDAAFETFKAGFSVSGGCDAKGEIQGSPVAPKLCDGGTVTVTYKVSDKCYEETISRDFTITAPSAVVPVSPDPFSASACAYADQAALDAAFETFKAGFSVSGGCDAKGEIQGSPTAPKLCDGGTVTVTYKVTDKCYETTISRDFTITAPSAVVPLSPDPFSASACAYADQTALDAAFETFKAGFSVSGGCDAKGEFVGSPTAPNLCQGGTTSVNYMITDKCYTTTINRDFTITAPSAVVPLSPDPFSASACGYADQTALDAAFETFKAGFSVSGGCDAKGEIQGSPVAPKLCDGGTVTVTYKVTDKCYETTISRDFTITAPSAVVSVSPDPFSASACGYADQAALDAAFETFKAGFSVSGGCDAKGEFVGSPTAPNLCQGGTTSVSYMITDKCYTTTISRDFTITAPSAVVPVSPDPFSASACAYADQAALDAAFEIFKQGFSVSGGCDAKGEFVGNATAPNLCQGGTTSVSYMITDKCYTTTISRDFTITAPSAVVPVSPDPFSASACGYADQAALDAAFETFKAGFSVSGGCDAKGEIQGSPTAPNLCDGGTVTVTFKVTDKCYETTISRDFTITAPSAVVPLSPDPFSASACGYADQAALDAAFETFKSGFSVSGGCDAKGEIQGSPTAPKLCDGGTATVTYKVTDKCYETTISRDFTITAPAAVVPVSPDTFSASACAYADQAAINAAFETFKQGFSVSGGCDAKGEIQGSPTAPKLCDGGTVTVTYKVTDKCYEETISRDFTITAPAAVVPVSPDTFSASACAYADQAAINAAFEIFKQGFSVSGGCDAKGSFVGNPIAPNLCQGGTTSVSYMITDKCYTTTITRDFTITVPEAVTPEAPAAVSASACIYADQAALDDAFETFKAGFKVSGGCDAKGVIQGSPVAPKLCEGGTTTVTYKVTDKCYETTISRDFTITKVNLLNVLSPPNKTVVCGEDPDGAFAAWIAGFKFTGGCAGNVQATDLSQFVKPQIGTALVIEYVVSNNCETIKKISTFLITPCTTPICTYTQGAYGNVGGMACVGGQSYTTKALIAKALSAYPGGTMTIGLVGKSVLVSNNQVDINGVIAVLPGGGASKKLANGDPHISALPASYLKKGKLDNTLLAQTITLGLNLGIDSELSKFKLQAGILAVAQPEGGCGSKTPKVRSCNPDGTVSNEYKYYTIPNNVVSKLGGDKTVGDLFNLANQALGGGNTYGVSLSDIASLVDLINNAFDECRIAIGYNIQPLACVATQESIVTQTPTAQETTVVESSAKESKKPGFDAYPVPFKNYITIRYNFDYATNVKIELFDLSGKLLSSKTDTDSYFGKEYNFNIDFYVGKFQVYILQITTNKGSSTKKIISAGN